MAKKPNVAALFLELEKWGLPVDQSDVLRIRSALDAHDYTHSNADGTKFFTSENYGDPQSGQKIVPVSYVAEEVAGYLLTNFEGHFDPDPSEPTKDLVAEKEEKEKQELLLQQADLRKGKRIDLLNAVNQQDFTLVEQSLTEYIDLLHQQDVCFVPTWDNDPTKSNVITPLVDIAKKKGAAVVSHGLDTLEAMISTGVDKSIVGCFVDGSMELYATLSPARVEAFVGTGLTKMQQLRETSLGTEEEKTDKAKQMGINYFYCQAESASNLLLLFEEQCEELENNSNNTLRAAQAAVALRDGDIVSLTAQVQAKDQSLTEKTTELSEKTQRLTEADQEKTRLGNELVAEQRKVSAAQQRVTDLDGQLAQVGTELTAEKGKYVAAQKGVDNWKSYAGVFSLVAGLVGLGVGLFIRSQTSGVDEKEYQQARQEITVLGQDVAALQDRNTQLNKTANGIQEQLQRTRASVARFNQTYAVRIERDVSNPSALAQDVRDYIQSIGGEFLASGPGCDNALRYLHGAMGGSPDTKDRFVATLRERSPLCEGVDSNQGLIVFDKEF